MTEPSISTRPIWEAWGRPVLSAQDPQRLRSVRDRASGFLDSAILPTPRDEDWRYTDLRLLSNLNFSIIEGEADGIAMPAAQALMPADVNVVLLNGVLAESPEGYGLPRGISILAGKEAIAAVGEAAFNLMTGNDSQLLLRLNDLHFRDLVLIDIEKDVDLRSLIHIVHLFDKKAVQKAIFPRIFIRLAEGARAKVFESSIVNDEQPVLVNAVMDIHLAERAALEIVQAGRNTAQMLRFISTRVVQQKDSQLHSFLFTDGALIFRHNLSVLLEGEGAEAVVNGLHRLKDSRHADSHTFVDHVAPNSRSNQLYKTILDGESRSVFNGRIRVRKEAQLTNSYQLNKNLILSRLARVNTKPQLEIFADDVKCSHGATIGQLDEDQLFYLGTRGIGKDAAMTMLIRGFIDDVVGQVRDPVLRDKLIQTMD